MRLFLLWMLFLSALGAENATTVNGLRLLLRSELDQQEEVLVITFENRQERREMFLPLGTVGMGLPESLELDLVDSHGVRQRLRFVGSTTPAPSRLVPRIIPLLPGSTYSFRTPLRFWRGARSGSLESQFTHGAWLQARLTAPVSPPQQWINCHGLQVFWHGEILSNQLQP